MENIYMKIYDMWEAMGLLPSTRASTVQSSWTRGPGGLGRPSSHGSGAIPGALVGPSFWMSACFQVLVVLLGQKSELMSSSFQKFWDHPGIRTIHAQDFKIKFSEPKSSWLVSPHPAWDIWDPLAHLFAKVGPTAGGTWQLGWHGQHACYVM
jgi:hypothetical protein